MGTLLSFDLSPITFCPSLGQTHTHELRGWQRRPLRLPTTWFQQLPIMRQVCSVCLLPLARPRPVPCHCLYFSVELCRCGYFPTCPLCPNHTYKSGRNSLMLRETQSTWKFPCLSQNRPWTAGLFTLGPKPSPHCAFICFCLMTLPC